MKSTETTATDKLIDTIKKKRNTQYLKYGNLELSLGNSKLGDDTIIFNMGSANNCPSRKLGFCLLGNKCYAYKAENLYPTVLEYRNRQEAYWLNNTALDIAMDIINALKSRRVRVDGKLVPMLDKIKYFRFNEAGDFFSQECVEKLDVIASMLAYYGIVTYGYTVRKDLDFSNVSFLVKGSGHDNGNNGKTIARKGLDDSGDKMVMKTGQKVKLHRIDDNYYAQCPADCTVCDLCKVPAKLNIVFELH